MPRKTFASSEEPLPVGNLAKYIAKKMDQAPSLALQKAMSAVERYAPLATTENMPPCEDHLGPLHPTTPPSSDAVSDSKQEYDAETIIVSRRANGGTQRDPAASAQQATPAPTQSSSPAGATQKRGRGRPKGSTTRPDAPSKGQGFVHGNKKVKQQEKKRKMEEERQREEEEMHRLGKRQKTPEQ